MHRLIVGISGAGKSRFTRETIVPAWRKKRVPVLVLDPVCQQWNCDWQTADPWQFLAVAQRSKGCILIVDECDESLRASPQIERGLKYIATRSRNDGHIAYFLAQRALQVPPSYRNQCSWIYAFQQTAEDAEELYRLTNRPELRQAVSLPLGTFIHTSPGKPAIRVKVF